ncbi:MAG: hypothetical protein Q4D87_01675 [Actinomycetaceae bacterium]|nr:hypothetical protein [Actinomycetaceae bacterium]
MTATFLSLALALPFSMAGAQEQPSETTSPSSQSTVESDSSDSSVPLESVGTDPEATELPVAEEGTSASPEDLEDLEVSGEEETSYAVRSSADARADGYVPNTGILGLETHGLMWDLELKDHVDPADFKVDPSGYIAVEPMTMTDYGTNGGLTPQQQKDIFNNAAGANLIRRNDGLSRDKENFGQLWGFLTGSGSGVHDGRYTKSGPVFLMSSGGYNQTWKPEYLVLVENLGVELKAGAAYDGRYFFGGFYYKDNKASQARFRVFEYNPTAQRYPVRILGDLPVGMPSTQGSAGMEFDAQGNLYILVASRFFGAEKKNHVNLYKVSASVLENRWQSARFGYEGTANSKLQTYFTDLTTNKQVSWPASEMYQVASLNEVSTSFANAAPYQTFKNMPLPYDVQGFAFGRDGSIFIQYNFDPYWGNLQDFDEGKIVDVPLSSFIRSYPLVFNTGTTAVVEQSQSRIVFASPRFPSSEIKEIDGGGYGPTFEVKKVVENRVALED